MRRISAKRRARNAEVEDFRRDFRDEIKTCEWCRKRPPVVHEIARGSGHRSKSLDKRFAILGLCDPGCHQGIGEAARAKQLALLLVRRPEDFDLPAYWLLTARRWPYLEDVLEWEAKLKEELNGNLRKP